MGLFVDTKKIASENSNLKGYIADYKDNSQLIFDELSKLYSYWKDDSTPLFQDKIREEEASNLLLVAMLEEISLFYNDVENIYDTLV